MALAMMVSKPARAAACAMPSPICPAPRTPSVRISMGALSLGPRSYDISGDAVNRDTAGYAPDRWPSAGAR